MKAELTHLLGAIVGFFAFAWHAFKLLSRLGLTGSPYKGKKMVLQKAFDPAALVAGLKAQGIPDAEKVVNDALPVLFDWLNSSINMVAPAPYGMIVSGVLVDLEGKALAEIKVLEASIDGSAKPA